FHLPGVSLFIRAQSGVGRRGLRAAVGGGLVAGYCFWADGIVDDGPSSIRQKSRVQSPKSRVRSSESRVQSRMSDELAKLKSRYERLERLYQVANVIHSTLEPQEALLLIVREAVRLMQASSGSVVLINPTNGFLEIHASQGLPSNAA